MKKKSAFTFTFFWCKRTIPNSCCFWYSNKIVSFWQILHLPSLVQELQFLQAQQLFFVRGILRGRVDQLVLLFGHRHTGAPAGSVRLRQGNGGRGRSAGNLGEKITKVLVTKKFFFAQFHISLRAAILLFAEILYLSYFFGKKNC